VRYDDLVRMACGRYDPEITPEKISERVAACQRHLDRLTASIAAARLDALVVVGDDQHEQYLEDNQPAFLVYCGSAIANGVLDLPAGAPEYWKRARAVYHEPDGPKDYPVASALGLFLLKQLIEDEFDVSCGTRLARPRGEGHAFGFVHRRLMASGVMPIVPLVVNTYYPPNQPTPRRCLALGISIRKAIEAWREDARIGILASGGLSHFTIDEDLDRGVLAACRARDGEALASLPAARLNSGSSEIRNWIVTAGAAGGLDTDWQAYVPLYRTPAGTGCGMAFAAWAGG